MSLTAGIVGLPNVGKSTLFNAITKQHILAANYPFATIEPNVGVVIVPDKRLEFLTALYFPVNTIPTTFEFIDIAGLVKGAAVGEGLGNKFLSHIREVDAICEVVRCFDDSNITHVEIGIDPIRDVEIVNVELMLADLEIINKRISVVGKKAAQSADKQIRQEHEVLTKIKDALNQNIPVRKIKFNEDELKMIKSFNLLTAKPIIFIANIAEKEIGMVDNEYVKALKEYALNNESEVISLCAKIESELSELSDDDHTMFLQELGLETSGLDSLIRATYHLLGLATYFTAGQPEVRAWTFVKGMKAPECAGIIHTDFEKGFIRAEIMSFDDLKKYGDEKLVKEAGKLRLEGKEYTMIDGDICHFRFSA